MDKIVVSGYYGYLDWEGSMTYCAVAQKLLEDGGQVGWVVQDITNAQNDPQDGRRVWNVTGLTQAGLDLIEENSLCAVQP